MAELSQEEKQLQFLDRAIAVTMAGTILLEAAVAVKSNRISAELYAEVMNKCISLQEISQLPYEEFIQKGEILSKEINEIFPSQKAELTPEQRRKMT